MKRIALLAFAIFLLTGLLVSCSAKELETPDSITYDGSIITWSPVENADGYLVKINDGEEWEVKTPSCMYNASDAVFQVSVRAASDNKKFSNSQAVIITFRPIGKVGAIQIADDGTLSWNSVVEATGYRIRIDGSALDEIVHDTTYADMPVGKHSIQICAVCQNDPGCYSVWSESISMTQLGTLSADDISYDNGRIKWKVVSGATGYEVKINGVALISDCKGTQYDYDACATDFEASVRAIGDHSASYDGDESPIKRFVFLDAVNNLRIEDGVLLWDAVAKASGYKVMVNGAEQADTLTECRYTHIPSDMTVSIRIKPISSDAAYFSDWSPAQSIMLLRTPVIQWNEEYELDGEANSNLYWDGIANAVGYTVRMTKPNGEVSVMNFSETQRTFQESYLEIGDYSVEVKALSDGTNPDVYDSAYCIPITVRRLAPPAPDGNEWLTSRPDDLSAGFTVRFSDIVGASGYILYRDNAEIMRTDSTRKYFTVTDFTEATSVEEQTYNFRIRCTGQIRQEKGATIVTLGSLSANSMAFDITILAVPSSSSVSGYTYSYNSVSKAADYAVAVGGSRYISKGTTYDLGGLEAGVFPISVCARGNGTNVLPSAYSAPITVHRLNAPTNLRIETSDASEGIVTFNSVNHATGYYVVFNNDGNAIPVDSMSNINQYVTEQGTTAYMYSSANYYSEDDKTYYMTSRPGTTANFIKLARPTTGDVAFNGQNLVWKAPSNINTDVYTPTYEVYYPSGIMYNGEKNGTSMDVSELEGGKSYTFLIKAIGNGTNYINSEKSEPITIYKLASPEVRRDKTAYVWNSVSGAVSYAVYVDGKLEATYSHQTGKTYEFKPAFKDLKPHTVEVLAIGDNGYSSLDSKPTVIVQETKQLMTPDFSISYSSDVYSDIGEIRIAITRESPYAIGYSYTVGGTTKTSSELTYYFCPGSVGSYTVRVYAIGGAFDEDGVYYIDSQSKGGNDAYTVILLATPNSSTVKLTADGLLTWTAVSDAQGYEVEYAVNGGAWSGIQFAKNTSIQIPNIKEANTLSVRIRAKGDGLKVISSANITHTIQNIDL